MGTGIDVAYPASNRALFEKICERGALVTEFPIARAATRGTSRSATA